MSRKNITVRSGAAVTAALLTTALSAGPALADHDHGQGASRDDARPSATHRQDGDRAQGRDHREGRGHREGHGEGQGRGDERGNGHTPVTVCHLLGTGGYHLLTMDDNALSAHLGHGDVYPDADGGCPAATAPDEAGTQTEKSTTEKSTTEKSTTDEGVTDEEAAGTTRSTGADRAGAVVLGEEAFARTGATATGQGGAVAGVEASRGGANRTAPVAGPVAGLLPQTGAGAMLSGALLAGAGLVAGGLALAARRRQSAL